MGFPPVERVGDGIDLALLDRADPDEGSRIIRGEHPEFAAARQPESQQFRQHLGRPGDVRAPGLLRH